MAALEREIIKQLQKLNPDQQQKVLEFARDLGNANEQKDADWENQPWTEEEIRELMRPKLKTGAEIAAMVEQMEPIDLVDPHITDPVEWLKAQRKKEADRLKPYWDGEV